MGRRRTGLIFAGCFVLALQTIFTAAWGRAEYIPRLPNLAEMPATIGDWRLTAEPRIDPDAEAMLSPDDSLNRIYTDRLGTDANLFIVYYRSQHRINQVHDPKVCLPGSGWIPIENRTIQISVPNLSSPFRANYYVIKNGTMTDIAIYWFQTVEGPTLETESVRLSKLFEPVRRNRSDVALVRVVVRQEPTEPKQTDLSALSFVTAAYPALAAYLPH